MGIDQRAVDGVLDLAGVRLITEPPAGKHDEAWSEESIREVNVPRPVGEVCCARHRMWHHAQLRHPIPI